MSPLEDFKKELEKASADHAVKKIINKMADKINDQDCVIDELSERLADIEEGGDLPSEENNKPEENNDP